MHASAPRPNRNPSPSRGAAPRRRRSRSVLIGQRKALIDSLNSLRKALYGKLSELPHALEPDEAVAALAQADEIRDAAAAKEAALEAKKKS